MALGIFKMIAISGFLTALDFRVQQIRFLSGRGSAPDPLGELKAPSNPLARLRGPTSRGRGKRRERGKGRRKGQEENGGTGPPFANSWIHPDNYISPMVASK